MEYLLMENPKADVDEPVQVFAEIGDDRRERKRVEFYAGGVCFSYGEERGREQLLRQEPYPQDLSLLSEGGAVWHVIPSSTFYHAWSQSGELPDGFQAMFGGFF